MELGATVCLPKQPQCPACPLGELCAARRLGRENELPLKILKSSPVEVEKQLLVIQKSHRILAWQRAPDSRRLANFWELPEPEHLPGAIVGPRIAAFRHTIVNTNYIFHVHRASARRIPQGFHWLPASKLSEVPLSTAARKAVACLAKESRRYEY
jgi:A/G-specific adenine glycosylase